MTRRMAYRETLDFLFNSLPMFQRQGKAAYKANLDNSIKLDERLSHPHRKFPSIHVAGTNGKGSVSHMLASIFQESGYKTGLYTSPHILDFRERIRINGEPIPEQEVAGFVNDHQPVIKEMVPSFFEMTVAMAFEYFARQKVEVAVVETGMGGRLDSTNIITPELSIITNISPDHTEFLGPDIKSIAREKAGIIKREIPLVIGHADNETEIFLLAAASGKNAPVTLAYKRYNILYSTLDSQGLSLIRIRDNEKESQETFGCDLTGEYQQENMITTLSAVDRMRERGWNLPKEYVERGLASVTANTGIMGRWQTVGSNPRSICDTAHNQAGIERVVTQIRQIPFNKLHMVWGVSGDKDLSSILPLLPADAYYYFTRADLPRSMDAEQLCNEAGKSGLQGRAFPSVEEAYKAAEQDADAGDLIFTGGSTFVVADLLKSLGY